MFHHIDRTFALLLRSFISSIVHIFETLEVLDLGITLGILKDFKKSRNIGTLKYKIIINGTLVNFIYLEDTESTRK